jgi:hypothetical protein
MAVNLKGQMRSEERCHILPSVLLTVICWPIYLDEALGATVRAVERRPEVGEENLVPIGDDFEWQAILAVPFFEEDLCEALRCKVTGGGYDSDV